MKSSSPQDSKRVSGSSTIIPPPSIKANYSKDLAQYRIKYITRQSSKMIEKLRSKNQRQEGSDFNQLNE